MQNIYFQYFLFISAVTVMSLGHSAYQTACSCGTDSKIVTDIWQWIRRNYQGLKEAVSFFVSTVWYKTSLVLHLNEGNNEQL
jgi:hypothetical protein